jgi:hypothetical protein
LKKEALSWRQRDPSEEDGVIVAADEAQEWLLLWWWKNYSRFNHYPVTFIDLGLSKKARLWCQQRGECFKLPYYGLTVASKDQIDPELVTSWEYFYGISCWDHRHLFFEKPFICLQTPYRKTIWLDLDCEVRSCLSEIFSYLGDSGFCISRDLNMSKALNKNIFNSGVIGFSHGHSLIMEWCRTAFDLHAQFCGDQDLISHLIVCRKEPIALLPSIYQWSRGHENNRPLSKLMVRRFSGLFWPLFDSNCRGNIRKLILPLQFGSKIGSKEPENRQNINFERGLMLWLESFIGMVSREKRKSVNDVNRMVWLFLSDRLSLEMRWRR